jgi:hypothetical protein
MKLAPLAILLSVALAPALFADSSLPESQPPISARAALNLPIPEINVDSIPFSRVVDYLRNLSGANIVVDWKILEAAGISKDNPITLQVRNVSFRKMLELALDQAAPSTHLVFTVDQNIIEITTQDDADSHMVTRAYDVNELLMPEQLDKAPPNLDPSAVASAASASGGSGGTSIFNQTTTTSQAANVSIQTRADALVAVIRSVVRPEIWRENGGTASIQYILGELIITAPLSVQEAIGTPAGATAKERYGM